MDWIRNYNGQLAKQDLLASLIVTVMLIPQSLAYAMLAGLPRPSRLVCLILPLMAYAALGSSMTLPLTGCCGFTHDGCQCRRGRNCRHRTNT